MTSLDHPPVVIGQSRVKLGLAFVFSAAVAATAVKLLIEGQTPHVFGMWCALILFAGAAAGALVCFVSPSQISVDQSGLSLKTAWGRWNYHWSDLDGFEVSSYRYFSRLTFDYASTCPDYLKGPARGRTRSFNPFWTMGVDELAKLLNAAKQKWGAPPTSDD